MDIRSRISLESAAARALCHDQEQVVVLDLDECNRNDISAFASRQRLVQARVEIRGQLGEQRWRVTIRAL